MPNKQQKSVAILYFIGYLCNFCCIVGNAYAVAESEGVRLLVVLEKCLIAYRKMLDRPFFSLTLRTASGQPLELVHNTPPGYYNQEAGAISANHVVRLRTPVAHIPPGAY